MFDPVVENIVRLIRNQLSASDQACSAIFLVGGFAESPYLEASIKQAFCLQVPIIIVPQNPITAVVRGATYYGLNKKAVKSRKLPLNYGVQVYPEWLPGVDPENRKTPDGHIYKFNCLAHRGSDAALDQKFSGDYIPIFPDQAGILFKVYCTPKNNARFCDEFGMKLVGEMEIDLPDVHLGLNRVIEFSLMFGELEIKATAWNKTTEKFYHVTFEYTKSIYKEPISSNTTEGGHKSPTS